MTLNPLAIKIRAKKLGLLLKDARTTKNNSISECAQFLGIPESVYEAYELGEKSPSLPIIEAISDYLKIPLDYFWKEQLLSQNFPQKKPINVEQLNLVRQRIIGALVRQFRIDLNINEEDIAKELGINKEEWIAYELGEIAIPLPNLEAICSKVGVPITAFQDRNNTANLQTSQNQLINEFLDLEPELQDFICKPINRPYLELAQRLSEMSVEKLRSVAEGLLEITL